MSLLLSSLMLISQLAINLESKPEPHRLRRHVQFLSGDLGERNLLSYQHLEAAADYIKKELHSYGYQLKEQLYHIENKPCRNIIATKIGLNKQERVIIVCSHYDSVSGSPGADDNASGVAGLLELARMLVKDNLNKTIKFVATTCEEPPFFMTEDMGSFRYAKEARQRQDNIEAVLCLESIGYYSDSPKSQSYPVGLNFFYPDKGDFIALGSNLNSRNLLKIVVREFKKHSSFAIEYLAVPVFLAPAISFSDNWAFWRFGYKAVMVTDTAFYRNPYYHTFEDTVEKLNYESMSKVIQGLYFVLLRLGR